MNYIALIFFVWLLLRWLGKGVSIHDLAGGDTYKSISWGGWEE